MIEKTEHATVITGEDIDRYQLLVLRGALYLETHGMTRRGESAYKIVKRRFGFTGSILEVMAKFDEWLEDHGIRDRVTW